MSPRRPIGPATEKIYRRVLTRAFGSHSLEALPAQLPDFSTWTEPTKALLRAAVKRRYLEAGRPPAEASIAADAIPVTWAPQRVTEPPAEEEAVAYEEAARRLAPGRRAMALLPLALGLRAAETVSLTRRAVERAAAHGELLVMRKGAKEQLLPAQHARGLFEEMLQVKSVKRTSLFESALAEGKPWKLAGQLISTGNPESAYHALHRIVHDLGEEVDIDDLRPHKLRHAFATRMERDGAPVPTIQWMLGHASMQTTLRYIHPGARDAAKYVRTF